ncbi:hypothetical protein EX30DRAFT_56337 [Ascodesmis nigricans]|uniref:Uncharacterized protein n=1 Tax=Ascodesmis nigricans TaxID=341454 RepID=A0A4S2MUM3_9PEZI|nr:hypothetical protein EX30DRAFT_56337 [Ascodesmis nigricans]
MFHPSTGRPGFCPDPWFLVLYSSMVLLTMFSLRPFFVSHCLLVQFVGRESVCHGLCRCVWIFVLLISLFFFCWRMRYDWIVCLMVTRTRTCLVTFRYYATNTGRWNG